MVHSQREGSKGEKEEGLEQGGCTPTYPLGLKMPYVSPTHPVFALLGVWRYVGWAPDALNT